MTAQASLMWFRQDLRLRDNPALTAAANSGPILPVYILDDTNSAPWQLGAASRWWLHQSLKALNAQLNDRLMVLRGDPRQLIPALAAEYNIEKIFWNRCYEPWRSQRDSELKQALKDAGLSVSSSNASLLIEPWLNLKDDGTPYKVFTPFYKKALSKGINLDSVLSAEPNPEFIQAELAANRLDALELMPAVEWHSGFAEVFTPGEAGAEQQLARFLEHGMSNYQQGRDFPALESVSRLSPHIHFGEIAPHRIYKDSLEFGRLKGVESESEHFGRELVWREFSYSLLHYFPSLTENNMNRDFDHFPWQKDESLLRCWQTGQTGYPLVDAGMRELWQTGYMHNRVRMIVGSFLVKNLLQDWREGARWFWDCLLDADLANNTASWQWVAGCGADAAPYFRIFNPISQSEKFKAAPYIRRFVPELAQLDDKHIHEPSAAPALILAAAGVKLGENYPKPVVGLKASREKALEAYQQLKARNQA